MASDTDCTTRYVRIACLPAVATDKPGMEVGTTIFAEVILDLEEVIYCTVETWRFNEVWIGDHASRCTIDDPTEYTFKGTEWDKYFVAEIMTAMNVGSWKDVGSWTDVQLWDHTDDLVLKIAGEEERNDITPKPPSRKPERLEDTPFPEKVRAASLSTADIPALVVFDDTTMQLDPRVLPQSKTFTIEKADMDCQGFLAMLRRTETSLQEVSLGDLLDEAFTRGGDMELYVMFPQKGQVNLYRWDDGFNRDRKA